MDFHNPEENYLWEFLHSGKRFMLITGEVNSGKSSLVEKIISFLKKNEKSIDGFYSKGIFDGNKKIGYNIVELKSGKLTQIASATTNKKFQMKQGKYFFNPEVFEDFNKINLRSIETDVFIVDEIGYLELKGKGFYPFVYKLIKHYEGKIILSIRKSILIEMMTKLKLENSKVKLFDVSNNDLYTKY
ncbi:MAG TPA: nucleoside-triphosphatase [Ignavibacteriaceae bacterium]|nr:nucleoside-triphosphatase [Ignavibacteriaceae bacterium]